MFSFLEKLTDQVNGMTRLLVDTITATSNEHAIVAPPSESRIPDPAVTLSDPDNDRLSLSYTSWRII